MIVVVPADSRSAGAACWEPPLAVSGTVLGRQVAALATAIPDVIAQIGQWVRDDPTAVGYWGLREDYSGELVMPVRRALGSVAERRRAVHVLRLVPGQAHGGVVAAVCGERLPLLDLETLELGAGMPCGRCLMGSISGKSFGTFTAELDRQDG
ncbi:MAG TPA: hypothetical protein VFW65_07030 [Pseudonocardiaceae bacterium]|nr:hypothetical protein [Pseudonocardiaceae bacterium]